MPQRQLNGSRKEFGGIWSSRASFPVLAEAQVSEQFEEWRASGPCIMRYRVGEAKARL